MSYSFNVNAESKAVAIEQVEAKLREIAVAQPVHGKDKLHTIAAAKTFFGLLEDDDARDVFVSMNGSIWTTEKGVQQVAISINANLQDRAKQA